MLQDIRQNAQGTAAKIIIGLIVIAFSIFGIESILLGGGGSGVAEVNGDEILPQELQQAVTTQKRRLISMMGDNYDPALLDDQKLSAQALDGLINRRLLLQSAEDMGLRVSDRQIGAVIAGMEQFQLDGKFSPEMYRRTLSSAGYTPAYFKQSLREDMLISQLRAGLIGSEFATPVELQLSARITAEQRDVRYLIIPHEKFLPQEDVDETRVAAYYADHEADFLTPESVDLEYITLSLDDFREPVDDTAIQEAYQAELANYQYQTENRISHILFVQGPDESDEQYAQRIASVQEKLSQGGDFAELAKSYSDDIGSAAKGGDLGYSSGEAFPEEMEKAIANLEVGQVSAPVKSDAGTHLIKVTERSKKDVPTLEEMRAELTERLQVEDARVRLVRAVEQLKDLSFNADNLSTPASEMGLSMQTADGITRTVTQEPFSAPAVLSAIFSDEVLSEGHNTDVIELGDDRFITLRVREHHQPQVQPLTAVRDQIVAAIRNQDMRDALAAEAKRLIDRLHSGVSMEALAKENGYEWRVELGADRRNTLLPAPVLQRAFELPAPQGQSSEFDSVSTVSADMLVLELARVTPGSLETLPPQARQALQQQVAREYGTIEDSEFGQALRDSADITVF